MKRILTAVALLSVGASGYAASPALTVYKDPNCGCCEEWVKHVNQAGIRTKVINSPDIAAVKTKLGVPAHFASCHTAVIDGSGQVVEGHVPATAIQKLAAEPSMKGMPSNSPGMGQLDGKLVTVDFAGRPFSND